MLQKLNLFKELFSPYINISILHIDNSLGLIDSALEEVRTQNEGNIKYISFIDEDSAKLKATAREFEYIVLGDILSFCKNQETILKLMYKALENSGNIIISGTKLYWTFWWFLYFYSKKNAPLGQRLIKWKINLAR